MSPTDKTEAVTKLVVLIMAEVAWLALVFWSGWMEWHGKHGHATWLLLFLIANSCGWLKSIAKNTKNHA